LNIELVYLKVMLYKIKYDRSKIKKRMLYVINSIRFYLSYIKHMKQCSCSLIRYKCDSAKINGDYFTMWMVMDWNSSCHKCQMKYNEKNIKNLDNCLYRVYTVNI
jgi:hypothetical protein